MGHCQLGMPGAGQGVDDGGADAALRVMVLGDDEPPSGGRGGRRQRGGVDRLDRVQVDDARGDAVGLELILQLLMQQAFVAGLKQGWAFAWRSLMAGELLVIIANHPSLGVLLSTDQDQADMASATAIIIVILVLGILVHGLFSMADGAIRRRWGLTGSS